MKKRDVIQLVKEIVKENTFYGNRKQPSQLSTGTKVSVPTDEYPFSRKPKRTATGMMEETFNAKDEYEDLDTSEREQVIASAGGREEDEAVMDYEDLKAKYDGFDDAIKDYVMEGVMEFQQPKSFDSDTIRLVREMLDAADIYHDELVDADTDKVSSFLDERSGGTYFVFPHFNGPQGRGAMFGKETTDQIDRSKAAAKAAALKTYTQFKTYIEDHEISEASPTGVYGNIYLFVMFNKLAKDYTAPKGGTQSSQFEENDLYQPDLSVYGKKDEDNSYYIDQIKRDLEELDDKEANEYLEDLAKTILNLRKLDEEEVHGKEIVITAGSLQNALTFIGRNLKNLSNSMLSRLLEILDVKDLKTLIDTFPHNVKDLKPKLKKMTPEEAKTFGLELNKFHTDMKRKNVKEADTKTYAGVDSVTSMKKDPRYGTLSGDAKIDLEKKLKDGGAVELEEEDLEEIGMFHDPLGYEPDDDEDLTLEPEEEDSYRDMIQGKYSDDDLKLEPELDEGEFTNDVGKDDYVDDEGRMAKSQMYKTGKYAMKLHDMLDDMEQLPAWVQAKLTKASDYLSAVYHYLDYEFVRRDSNLMEHVDKYNKRALLMEGAMKKFFEMFDQGKTDEEIVQDYAHKGTQVPEAFVTKARRQYEGMKKLKLELEMSEKEFRNSSEKMVNNAEEGMEPGMEEKTLASGLTNEEPNEGNAFGLAMQKAKEAGDDSFELDGKTFKVEK